uniref:Multidrug resistance protein 1 n=1 Tax=Rhabditophanes sp. KR3021 TaxID=114890 RepID=A0AC35TT20_9BILA
MVCKKGTPTDDDEKEKVKEVKPPTVSLFKLWKYASKSDVFLVFLGILVAIGTGSGMPLFSIIIGDISKSFINAIILQDAGNDPTKLPPNFNYGWPDFTSDILNECYMYCYLGGGILAAAFIQVLCFQISCENMNYVLKKAFFKSILRQNIAWYDENSTGALSSKMFDNLERVKEGTGDKVGLLIQFTSQFLCGFAVAFTYSWKLTLIMLSLSPFMMICGGFIAKLMSSASTREAEKYAKSGAIADEVIGNIKTVTAFNGQERECLRYNVSLKDALKDGVQKSIFIGAGLGVTFLIIFASYCLGFYIGVDYVYWGMAESNVVFTCFFSVMMGSAAYSIYEVIDRQPDIDSSSEEGVKPEIIKGRIEVRDIKFAYPTRPDVQVLKGISFEALPGETVALVGSSGSGKSTIIQLLLRYYQQHSGSILIDGHEIQDFNLKYLRSLIGVVSQEATVFNASIYDNVSCFDETISEPDVINALKKANAWEFVSQFPEQLNTILGPRGSQLSGGQKARIGIAAAILHNPIIEHVVQKALDRASVGRTTIVVAHRLSTIKNANKILVMKHGEIVESGTHNELLEKKGFYHELVNTQVFADLGLEDDQKPKSKRERLASLNSEASRRSSVVSYKKNGEIDLAATHKFVKGDHSVNAIEDEKDDLKRLQVLGAFQGATLFASSFFFGLSSEKLTSRLRGTLFRNIVGREIAYFDDPRHSSGRLVTRLATDCPNVKNSLSYQLGQVLSGVIGFFAGIGIAIYYSWQMALLCMIIFPIAGVAQGLQFKYISSRSKEDDMGTEAAGKVALEAIENIKAVQALTLEDRMFQMFGNHLKYPHMTSRRKALLQAVIYSISSSITFFINAAAFRLALYLIREQGMHPLDCMKAIYAFAFSATGIGFAASYIPEYTKARLASGIIFSMLKEHNSIVIFSEGGKKPEIKGHIEFKNLHFNYPQRKDVKVLKNLSISVEPKKSLALVGPSGCGKSTTVGLLERFYDPQAGSILIDGHDLRELNLHHVRSQFALVGQQPVLFDCSIRDNLLYGIEEQNISDDRIMEVLKMCNIWDFVNSLPDGLDTNVGAKGSQLSGGQRSRFAIGQAIIRSPKLIILDEAFAALDNESEKLVQDAVDKISKDFTVISIAHRLSSIAHFDTIAVIKDGIVIEKGNHVELMSNKKGLYHELTERQNLKSN